MFVKWGKAETEYPVKIWAGEVMEGDTLALDTETELVDKWTNTPKLVTLQAFDGKTCYYISPEDSHKFIIENQDKNQIWINFPFDCDVLCKQWNDPNAFEDSIENDKIWDIGVLYRLIHLAKEGWVARRFNLKLLAKKYWDVELDKNEDIRLGFGKYSGQPLSSIPEDFLTYGALDVVANYYIYYSLLAEMSSLPNLGEHRSKNLSHGYQIRGDIALNRIYKRGIGFDVEKAQMLASNIQSEMSKHQTQLAHWGWVRGRKGSKVAFQGIAESFNVKLPYTEKGELSTKEEDLKPFMHIPIINSYNEFHKLEKQVSFIKNVKETTVHPRYSLLMNTGRTSCSKPNFQQLPREGGIRQLFKAEPGNTFLITDYSTVELATLGQVCLNRFGQSTMAEKINAGDDLHRYYASILYSKDMADITKAERQSAKAANFGFPGGLGLGTFITFAAGYGLNLDHKEAQRMKTAWFDAFPEMVEYLSDPKGYVITETGRLRAKPTFCAEKNTPFQGLASDGAKLALYGLDLAGYAIRGFCHDEIVSEVPIIQAEELLRQHEEIMISSMRQVCPDVRISVESQISEVYTK